MNIYQFIGVDVSKDKFDTAHFINNKPHSNIFTNNLKGHKEFLKYLKQYGPHVWVCMEATGHYSEVIAEFLIANKIRVSVINPWQIKSYGRAVLSRNKTDKLDAKLIARYAETMKHEEFIQRSESQKALKDLLNLLNTLKAQHTQLSNQLHSARSQTAKKLLRKLIRALEKEIEGVEKEIAELTKKSDSFNENIKLITSIKGVGKLTAYQLLAHVPDINRFSNAKQFAAFMGITPKHHQSGKLKGKTTLSRLGNPSLRKALYMAAMVSKRCNESIAPFVSRLKERGKQPKVIICAVMRKLAHIIFGILKNKRPFDATLA